MQLYGQAMIIPLDGEKSDFEKEQIFHALYQKLTNEEYTHQNELAKIGYKIVEAGSKTFLRIDVILQKIPQKMKQSMVKDILDELMQVFLNVDLQGFQHMVGKTLSNDPFIIS